MNYISLPHSFFKSELVGKGNYQLSAIYCILSRSCFKGSIHNYKSLLPKLAKRYNVCERTLRNGIAKLVKKKWILLKGENISIISKRLIVKRLSIFNDEQKKLSRGKLHKIYFKDYSELKDLIKSKALALYQKNVAYMFDKADPNKMNHAKNGTQLRGFGKGSTTVDNGISRMKFAKRLGYSSAMSGVNLIRKAVKFKICEDKRRNREVVNAQATTQDYKHLLNLNKGCALLKKNNEGTGVLVEFKANLVTFTQTREWNKC